MYNGVKLFHFLDDIFRCLQESIGTCIVLVALVSSVAISVILNVGGAYD